MRQVPKREAKVILLCVPCSERAPPADLATDDQVAPAALGGVVVRWHVRFGHKDKEFPDVAFNASAQLGLGCRRVVPEGLAEGQQLSFQGQLGGAPPLGLGMSAGFGPVVNPVDSVGPPGQWCSIGVAGTLVVDVPQQVGPAALLGAIIMVVGSVEIADQYSGESIAQGFIHHRLAPAPPQKIPFGGGAESPHVAVGPALTPAGFVGPVSSAWTTGLARTRSSMPATISWAFCAV